VLWALNKIDKTDVKISGKAIAIVSGCCSNIEPNAAIKDLPLASLDTAWYLLAEAEIAAGVNAGIADGLSQRLIGGKIPFMELNLRRRRLQKAIELSDTIRFVQLLPNYLEAMALLATEGAKWRENFDPINPPRGEIPETDLRTAFVEGAAVDAIIAFGMCAVYAGRNSHMRGLQSELRNAYGESYPGNTLFAVENTSLPSLNGAVGAMLRWLDEPQHIEPRNFWTIGLRFFEYINQSNFRTELEPLLAEWLRGGWIRIARDEAFRLTLPIQTVPPINSVLTNPNNDREFIAALLLAASEAVRSPLSKAYVASLQEMASGHEQRKRVTNELPMVCNE
jgi:hypothetical protein